jgi:hypothetical protein
MRRREFVYLQVIGLGDLLVIDHRRNINYKDNLINHCTTKMVFGKKKKEIITHLVELTD